MSLHNHKLGIPHFPANFESYFCIHTLTISCRCFELFALHDELEVPNYVTFGSFAQNSN